MYKLKANKNERCTAYTFKSRTRLQECSIRVLCLLIYNIVKKWKKLPASCKHTSMLGLVPGYIPKISRQPKQHQKGSKGRVWRHGRRPGESGGWDELMQKLCCANVVVDLYWKFFWTMMGALWGTPWSSVFCGIWGKSVTFGLWHLLWKVLPKVSVSLFV